MTAAVDLRAEALLDTARCGTLRSAGRALLVVGVAIAALAISGFFDASRFADGWPALRQLASEMIPPDFARWRQWLVPLRDTLAMSIAGTALAVLLSLPLALLAAPNTAPHRAISAAARTLLAALRSVPEIILGVLFVAAVGFGALPGVLALALHSVGMVAKFYAEAIEHVDPRPLEAAAAAGAGRLQVILHAVLPQVLPQLADIRASAVLGIVGAGGIGFELMAALRLIRYDQVAAILLTILACVVVVDGLGGALRRQLK
jgi:phosphonate transport system permease protein